MKTWHDECVPETVDLDLVVEPTLVVAEDVPAATQLRNSESLGKLPKEWLACFRWVRAYMHNSMFGLK
jgi:hypothetical protein